MDLPEPGEWPIAGARVSSAPNGKRRQILPSADRKLAAPWAKGLAPRGSNRLAAAFICRKNHGNFAGELPKGVAPVSQPGARVAGRPRSKANRLQELLRSLTRP